MTADEPLLPNLWIAGEGPEQDVVVSSRMRLARNVVGHRFRSRQQEEDARRLADELREVLLDVEPSLRWLAVDELSDVVREVLFERHVVSRELVNDEGPRGVAFNTDATTSVLVNEEDHLRIQVFAPGLALERLVDRIDALDDRVGERVEYTFLPRYGYLTACPTNAGTGLRVSVMLHLPALSYRAPSDRDRSKAADPLIVKVHGFAQKLGLTVRGLHGESSKAEGDFYQISNQVTMGCPPEKAIADLESFLPEVLDLERKTREILVEEHGPRIEDKVWRAWAILRFARLITSSEAFVHLSALRLGRVLGIFDAVDLTQLHTLMVTIRPGHLQHRAGRALDPVERDVFRADLIRDTLKSA